MHQVQAHLERLQLKMDVSKFILNNSISIIVRPNASKNEILAYDEAKKALRVAIAAVPDKNKANKEIIKFFSKLLGKKVVIKKGLRSRNKVLEII